MYLRGFGQFQAWAKQPAHGTVTEQGLGGPRHQKGAPLPAESEVQSGAGGETVTVTVTVTHTGLSPLLAGAAASL